MVDFILAIPYNQTFLFEVFYMIFFELEILDFISCVLNYSHLFVNVSYFKVLLVRSTPKYFIEYSFSCPQFHFPLGFLDMLLRTLNTKYELFISLNKKSLAELRFTPFLLRLKFLRSFDLFLIFIFEILSSLFPFCVFKFHILKIVRITIIPLLL